MSTTASFPTTSSALRSRSPALKSVAGVCLILGGVLNGLPQYLGHLLIPEGDTFSDQIRWSVDHPGLHQAEQLTMLVSSLFMPVGLLGLAWVAHHHSRRLALAAAVLTFWGMWGFQNILAMGYTAGTVGPGAIGVDDAVRLNEGLIDDGAVLATALLPHLLGSFFGLLLLSVACWRSGVPKAPVLLMVVFLVWDFALAPVGPLEPHLLLVVAWGWLGIHLLRMPTSEWRGGVGDRAGDTEPAAKPY